MNTLIKIIYIEKIKYIKIKYSRKLFRKIWKKIYNKDENINAKFVININRYKIYIGISI